MTSRALQVMKVINGLGTGGAERSIAELAPLLRVRGINLTFVCSYPRQQGVVPELLEEDFEVIHLSRRGFVLRLFELRKLIRDRQPDLVHTTIIESDILGRLAAAGSGVPVVSSLVNTSYDPVRLQDPNVSRFGFELVRMLDGLTARHLAAEFHALTEAVADDAVSALGIPRESITVFGRGRDPSRLGVKTAERRRRVRESLGLTEEHQVVLAAGREEFQKGHVVLVHAAELLRDNTLLRVLIAGRPGSQTAAIQRAIIDAGLEHVVGQLGHRPDLPDLLAAADVFAFPSRYEGLGGSLIEAMMLGVPCVVSDLPALREVGDQAFRYAESENPAAWSAALADLLSDPRESWKLAQLGTRRAHTLFDVESIADRLLLWYQRASRLDKGSISWA